jgi:L-alanine-DL-glutamate epimerase-like enolase superfamily enzyme
MPKSLGIRCTETTLYFLPVETRVPLKFGPEILTSVTCARVRMRVVAPDGRTAEGWGETPLSVQWVWPGSLGYEERYSALEAFCRRLAHAWPEFDRDGHPLAVGYAFLEERLPGLVEEFNDLRAGSEPMPRLAALVCCSPFDVALHDAFATLHRVSVYESYSADFLDGDLTRFLGPAEDSAASFRGTRLADFLVRPRPDRLTAWHLVGGTDPVDASELTGGEPDDGYPVLLPDWIRRDGLKCLKVKLRGNDADWDFRRLIKVGGAALENEVWWLSADFNCTVTDPDYVNEILDRLMADHPRLFGMILYVEQPFPYDLETYRIDVRSVSARKPLFMDESAHDWRMVELGRRLGWSGVALKTCKTQTGALLALCWARTHGMTLMVQDLTNPMLAQIPHLLLGAHAGTIMGVETNSMQFYPEASRAEEAVHPGLYRRREGRVDLTSIRGAGFGYRLDEIERVLPEPVESVEARSGWI